MADSSLLTRASQGDTQCRVAGWRDEITEAVKSKAERDAEEQARHRKRVEEALATADTAMRLAAEALGFTRDRLKDKGQVADIGQQKDQYRLALRDYSLSLELV